MVGWWCAALEAAGIYRVPGSLSDVDTLKRELVSAGADGPTVSLSKYGAMPFVVSSAVISLLRDLPQPLLTHSLYSSFLAAYGVWLCVSHPRWRRCMRGVRTHASCVSVTVCVVDGACAFLITAKSDVSQREQAVSSLLRSLPKAHLHLVESLCWHLYRVASHSHMNDMVSVLLTLLWLHPISASCPCLLGSLNCFPSSRTCRTL